MGVKAMIRNSEAENRIALAKRLLDCNWDDLTVRQVNFLYRYVSIHS